MVMWSLANEPRSYKPESSSYFSGVAEHMRSLDPARPLTIVMYDHDEDVTDYAAPWVDIIRLGTIVQVIW